MRKLLSAGLLAMAVAGICIPVTLRPTAAAPMEPAAVGGPAPDAPAPASNANQVPVKVVVLFSSGVGYFEHDGTVKGGSSTELRFKTNQINDILKSLLLQSSSGKIGTVDYPSQDPIEKTLHSFQVDITGNPPLAGLLEQLRGAKVKLSIGAEEIVGTILGLEQREKGTVDNKEKIEVWVLNLLTAGTIRSIELPTISGLHLEDPQLQEELNKALTALAQARDQDKKPVTIHFQGEGDRDVRIGYVVETPVWKTSYRLILTDNPTVKPATQASEAGMFHDGKLQGWAIVENQTDNDWNNVELSLISGRPISFIQNLYQPLYVPRPVVQPQLYASLRPQTYDAGMDDQKPAADFAAAPSENGLRKKDEALAEARGGDRRAAYRDAADAPVANKFAQEERKSLAMAPMDATASVGSLASAAKMGELFQYTVGSVSLPRQRSAMIPIITDDVEVEKLSIYNPNVLPRNPLNGARVRNTTGKHLLSGPITVLEGSGYAGDARIDDVPPGQERLLSYGVDLQMLVDATKNKQEQAIVTGKIVKGVLNLQYKNQMSQEYLAENKGDKEKTLIIEHPLHAGWKLVEPLKPIETTETLYRFKGKVPAGQSTKLTVKEELVNWQSIAILPMDDSSLEFYGRTGEIPADVKAALSKAGSLKQDLAVTERTIQQRRQDVNRITAEQGRIRQNMTTVSDRTSAYYTRLLTKLNDQETQLEKLQAELDELQKTQENQKKELEDYLNNLNVE